MIDFTKVKWFKLPEGTVSTMTDALGNVLWRAPVPEVTGINYVSLGDSIAAGHAIDDNWQRQYGENSQFGVGGRTSTVIVPGSYTDILRGHLQSIYGADKVSAVSFARSGERVKDLIPKLDNVHVRDAIAKAHLVTLCIGANDVLEPALSKLEEYINTGDLSEIAAIVDGNLSNLANDASATSFKALFDKLTSINPHARYVFMTIYNPYKFLWCEEGYNGFFKPILDLIPEMNIDVDKIIEDRFLGGKELTYFDISAWKWREIELDIDVDDLIRDGLLAVPIVKKLFDRVNGLCDWSENYVSRLNTVMRDAISRYQSTSGNISLVDAKAAFDLFPDRQNSGGVVEYNELVNVEFTRGYNTGTMDWGALWRHDSGGAAGYWWGLVWDNLHFQLSDPYVSFDLEGLAADLVQHTIERVIVPNVDPHPEHDGQQVLARVFANGIGLIKYNAEKSWYETGCAALAQKTADYQTPLRWGYDFGGWYTDASFVSANNVGRVDLAEGKVLAIGDLDGGGYIIGRAPKVTQLYAKWTEMEV